MSGPGCLLVRADAGDRLGTGHIMRMLALGQAWVRRGGEVFFLCAEIQESLQTRVTSQLQNHTSAQF